MARKLTLLPRFKRDYQKAARLPGFDRDSFEYLLGLLIEGPLPPAFREHPLEKRGRNYVGMTECHLDADVLLIYRSLEQEVKLHRIGSHMELFGLGRRSSS